MMAKDPQSANKRAKLKMPSGWLLTGQKAGKYEAGTDPDMLHEGNPCFVLKEKDDSETTEAWVTLMSSIPSAEHNGKRLQMSMWLKTESAARVTPWMRVDGQQRDITAFDNWCARPITRTNDWRNVSVTLDVAAQSSQVSYGVILAGSGSVWITDPEFEEVGEEIPTTDCACMKGIEAKVSKQKAGKQKSGR